jgi:hypothetical protein
MIALESLTHEHGDGHDDVTKCASIDCILSGKTTVVCCEIL